MLIYSQEDWKTAGVEQISTMCTGANSLLCSQKQTNCRTIPDQIQ